MNQGAITPEVARFIAEFIMSADQLDILLLLHSDPEREWSALDVSRSVFTVPTAATLRLEELLARGFLVSTGGSDPRYRYQPATPALGRQVDALAAAYRADRVGVIKLVFDTPVDPLASFSNAFRLRRDG